MKAKRFFFVCLASTAAGVLVFSALMPVVLGMAESNTDIIAHSPPLFDVISSAFVHIGVVLGPVALLVVALSGAGAQWYLRRTRQQAATHVLVFGLLEGSVLVGGGWLAFTFTGGSSWTLPDYMMFGVGAVCGAVAAAVFLALMRVKDHTEPEL